MKDNELRLSENFSIRPNILLQHWTELLQDRYRHQEDGSPGKLEFNTFVRRVRVGFAGTVFKKLSYLVSLEAANLGRAYTDPLDGTVIKQGYPMTQPPDTPFANFGVLFQDAFLSLDLHPAFSIQAGIMALPFARQTLQSPAHYISLDILTTSTTFATATQTSNLRDTGVQLKGILFDRLEYRMGVFQGIRQGPEITPERGSKNAPRLTGYLQCNVLDPEGGYAFAGQYFGHKNVLGIGTGFDFQDNDDADAYWAGSAAAFASIRLSGNEKNGGDTLDALVQFLHFHPGTTLPPAALLPGGVARQNDIGAELGYYNRWLSASVFGKFELRKITDEDRTFQEANMRIYGGGVKYFIAEDNAHVTFAYNRIETPDANPTTSNPGVQYVLALQLYYF